MSDARVRVALIGCGTWGSNILRVLAQSPRAEVVAVADPRPHQRRNAEAIAPAAALVASLDEALDAALTQRRIPHEFRLLAGPHDYPFNRGPGGVEMLLFHDRALRGLPAL